MAMLRAKYSVLKKLKINKILFGESPKFSDQELNQLKQDKMFYEGQSVKELKAYLESKKLFFIPVK